MSNSVSFVRAALHVAQLTFWNVTRVVLLLWGVMNGLGVGLIGRVQRVSQRISQRVQRVSGSAHL